MIEITETMPIGIGNHLPADSCGTLCDGGDLRGYGRTNVQVDRASTRRGIPGTCGKGYGTCNIGF